MEQKFKHQVYGWYLIKHIDGFLRWHLINCDYDVLDLILEKLKTRSSLNERTILLDQLAPN